MKKAIGLLLVLLIATTGGSVKASDTKVHGRLYTEWMLDNSDGADNANEFSIGRAYVTVKSKLSNNSSVRITTDLRESEVEGKDRYDVIVKYGYFDWKPEFGKGKLKFRLGLQPTMYTDNQNKLWGRRYLEKTVGDKNKYLTTSDLGASAHMGLGEKGKVGTISVAVLNGTAYSSLGENNKHKDYNVVAIFKPMHKNEDLKRTTIIGQFYHGVQNETIGQEVDTNVTPNDTTVAVGSDYKKQIVSFGGLFAYKKTLDIGADFNFVTNGNGPFNTTETKESGMSFHGTLYFADFVEDNSILKNLNVFGRVDINDPNTDASDDGNTHIIAGVETIPAKGFKASLNFRQTSYEADGIDSKSELVFNTLFKF